MKIYLGTDALPPDDWIAIRKTEEFISLFQREKSNITHIKLDYVLGGIKTGYDVYKYVKKEKPEIDVTFVGYVPKHIGFKIKVEVKDV